MPYLLLALVPAAFGLNPVIARALAGVYEPGTLTFIRWALSALLIGTIALARGRNERWNLGARDLPRLLFLGALGMGFCSFAAYAGVKTATATTVGLIYACTSALVTAVELVEGTTKPSAMLFAGVIACFTGVAVLLTRGDLMAITELSIGAGELWAVGGTVLWAGYTLAMRKKPGDMTPFALFTVLALIGAAFAAPVAGIEIAEKGLPPFDGSIALWLTALVLITGVGAFLGYNVSIRLSGPVLTAASISLAPLYIAVMATLLLGEAVGLHHLAAIACVVSGLVLITLARARPAGAA